nr:MAG TPA: hypothetical protein [Caudoviricetes sp.]
MQLVATIINPSMYRVRNLCSIFSVSFILLS